MAVAERVAVRVAALLDSWNDESPDRDEPGLAALYGASVVGRIAEGPHAGRRVTTAGSISGGSSPGRSVRGRKR